MTCLRLAAHEERHQQHQARLLCVIGTGYPWTQSYFVGNDDRESLAKQLTSAI
jgi:uncharacterized membrane protein